MRRFFTISLLLFLAAPALGQRPLERGEILKDGEWKAVYDGCVPDPALVASLKSLALEIRIDVYLGLWCGDSKDHVPVFLKIVDALESPDLQVNFFAVERKAAPEQKYYAEEAGVERVPTFIVFSPDGKEKGRIVETPKVSILEDLINLLL